MDENKEEIKTVNEDVKQTINQEAVKEKKLFDPNNKKILTYGIIGGAALLLLIIIIAVIAIAGGKPSKSKAEKLVKTYIQAMNDDDGDKASEAVDIEGYLIFNDEGEKKFDKNYKNKKKFLKEYYEDHDLDDKDDAIDYFKKYFESRYSYSTTEYSLKEIASIEKSSKSKKIFVVKAKVKQKTTYSTNTTTYKFYVTKVSGKYKIVGIEN